MSLPVFAFELGRSTGFPLTTTSRWASSTVPATAYALLLHESGGTPRARFRGLLFLTRGADDRSRAKSLVI